MAPFTGELTTVDDGRYRLSCEGLLPGITGGYYNLYLTEIERSRLHGNETEVVLEEDDLIPVLERAEMPIVFDGEFYWSADLAEKIGK
jgi:hypothetical protein